MQHKTKSLIGFSIGAIDGEIGEIKEFYFDDHTWTVRYLIVETGSWLNNRRVLLSPEALLTPDWKNKVFPVNLTKEQIKNSPDIDTERTVSRQHEIEMYNYYPWTTYWGGGMGSSGMMTEASEPLEEAVKSESIKKTKHSIGDDYLRSTHKVTGYSIHATDGKIGEVEDFIIDDASWKLEFLEVNTGDWFQDKNVLLSPKLVKEIDWENSEIELNVSKEDVKNSPAYEPSESLSESYATNLQNYYGKFI